MTRLSIVALALMVLGGCSRRPLSNEQLSASIEEQKSALDACYDSALAKKPDPKPRTGDAILIVEPSGKVSSVSVQGDLELPGLESCLHDALMEFRFPEASAKTRTSLPLIFEPKVVKQEALGPVAP